MKQPCYFCGRLFNYEILIDRRPYIEETTGNVQMVGKYISVCPPCEEDAQGERRERERRWDAEFSGKPYVPMPRKKRTRAVREVQKIHATRVTMGGKTTNGDFVGAVDNKGKYDSDERKEEENNDEDIVEKLRKMFGDD